MVALLNVRCIARRSVRGLGLMAIVGAILGWVDPARIDGLPGTIAQYAEEARFVALVAGGAVAVLLDREQDGVVVAVDPDLVHGLVVAGLFTLAPQAVARARGVAGVARPAGLPANRAGHLCDPQEAG